MSASTGIVGGSMASGGASRLDAFEGRVFRFERLLCISALAVMLLATIESVAVRYFNLPLPSLGEWAVIAMSPLTFVGAAMCSYTGSHIAVDVIDTLGSPTVRRLSRFAVSAATLVFATVYLVTGWTFLTSTLESGERLIDLGTPVAVPVVFLPLGMALVLLHTAADIRRCLSFQGDPEAAPP
ncbi:MAG TPA: TRAP transporter small permease [Azospirillaceae bacterium]|nr:TRAP transporter small permease [Azospirillaceae bacterium]